MTTKSKLSPVIAAEQDPSQKLTTVHRSHSNMAALWRTFQFVLSLQNLLLSVSLTQSSFRSLCQFLYLLQSLCLLWKPIQVNLSKKLTSLTYSRPKVVVSNTINLVSKVANSPTISIKSALRSIINPRNKVNLSTKDHSVYTLTQNGRSMVNFVLEFRELAKTSSLGDSELIASFLGGLDDLWSSRMPKNLLKGSLTECLYYALQLSRSTPSGPSPQSSLIMTADRESSPITTAYHQTSHIMAVVPEGPPVKATSIEFLF